MPATVVEFAPTDRTRSGLHPRIAGRLPVHPTLPPTEPTNTRGPRPIRRWQLLLGLILVAAVAVSASGQPWKALQADVPAKTGHSEADLLSVTVASPTPAATASVVLPATVRPWQTTSLHARVNGYLAAWHNELGERVSAGDLLAEIATPELDQEVAQGEALVLEADAAVVQARAERTEAEADLKVAEAQLVRIQAETALARSQLARREKLLASKSVSQEEYETSQRQLESRAADVTAAESDINRRRANLETRAAIITAREAAVHSRRANVDRLKELQGFKRIIAPFDGFVTRRTAEVGMLVTAGQESLFVVEDLSRVRVQVNVPQSYSVQATRGVEALVKLPESAAEAVRATITRVADSVDSTNRTMLAEIELENTAYHFQPGSYAQVTLITPQDNASWTIPTNTLSMRVDGPHVALVNEQNQIEIRRVVLGRDLGTKIVVKEGISGDERLVVNPGDDLTDGVRIRINSDREPGHELAQR